MTQAERRALNAAFDTARLTMKSMASALGISPSALRRYRKGSRPLPDGMLEGVAALLRYQAERLMHKADRLDEIAEKRKQVKRRRSS